MEYIIKVSPLLESAVMDKANEHRVKVSVVLERIVRLGTYMLANDDLVYAVPDEDGTLRQVDGFTDLGSEDPDRWL